MAPQFRRISQNGFELKWAKNKVCAWWYGDLRMRHELTIIAWIHRFEWPANLMQHIICSVYSLSS